MVMKTIRRKTHPWLAALAAATAVLALSVSASDARIDGPTGMLTNAANAVLPAAQNNLGLPVTVNSYGAKCDGASYTDDGAIAAGSNQFTSANIVAADAGKTILVANAGGTLSINNFNTKNAIAAAGTGYNVNDTITLAGGTGTAAVLKVTTTGGGGTVTGYSVQGFGAYTVAPANPVAQASTSGSGTGFTVNIGWFGAPLVTTITSVSGTTATLATTATATLAAASGTNSYWLVGTDDTAAIQATINAAEVVSAPPANSVVSFQGAGQNCLISSTLSITGNGVSLAGNGIAQNGNFPHYNYLSSMTEPSPGTTLVWAGASSGVMLSREPAAASPPLQSGGIEGIGFACESLAATAIKIASANKGEYPHLRLENCIGNTLDLEDSANPPTAIDTGTQQNHFGEITIASKTPLTQSAVGVMMNGGSGRGNTSGNIFDNLRGSGIVGQLLDCKDADSNWFGHVWGGTVTLDAGGAAPGCFSNYFVSVEPGANGTVYARGTETGTPASLNNFIAAYATNNGGPSEPTCGTAAHLSWGKPESGEINTCSGKISFPTGITSAGPVALSGLSAGTQLSCLGLDASNNLVTAACGAGGMTTLPNTDIYVGNSSNVATAVALSGDCTMANTGAITCTKINGDANVAFLDVAHSFTKSQRGMPVNTAISTATFTPNFDNSQNFEIDLTSACPCTLANPSTSLVAGQSGMIEIHQDGTGSRTIGTWGTDYQYAGGTSTITLSTTASAIDYLPYYVNNAATGIVLGTLLKAPAH
ncbi:MAG: hypothetical protein WA459_03445 [Stellaceae bacterium]